MANVSIETGKRFINGTQENSEIITLFRKLTKDKQQWYGLNDSDCTLNCVNAPNELKIQFCILPDEKLLFIRDTSFWNSKNQGLVITDRGLHIVVDNDSPEDVLFFTWRELDKFVFKCIDDIPHICFSIKGETDYWHLPTSFFSKGIDGVPASKQKKVSSYLVKLMQQLADTEPCFMIDIEAALDATSYDWEPDISINIKQVRSSKLREAILTADIKQAEKIPELANFVEEINIYESLKDSINKKLSTSIENIKKTSRNIVNQHINMYNQRVVARGGRVPTKEDLIGDAINLGTIAATKLIEKHQTKAYERAIRIYNTMVDTICEKWMMETIEYICTQLTLLTATRKNIEKLHLQILQKEIKTFSLSDIECSNMLVLATSMLCHALYLEDHAKNTVNYYCSVLCKEEDTTDYFDFEDFVDYELATWPKKLS